tara:strand:- start:692 stop:1300 length:609 start_codon:yes stop_codon:yes gene_type:complete
MPRKRSTMGLMVDHSDRSQLLLMKNGLKQNDAVYRDLKGMLDKYVYPQYVVMYNNADFVNLEYYIMNHEAEVLERVDFYRKVNESVQTNYLAEFVYALVSIVGKAIGAAASIEGYLAQIRNLQEIVDDLPQALEVFEAPLQASIQANVELDVRYLFYIKKYGPPPGGVFDPVKLQEFVITGTAQEEAVEEDEERYGEIPDVV